MPHRTYLARGEMVSGPSISHSAQQNPMVSTPKPLMVFIRFRDKTVRRVKFLNFSSHENIEDLEIVVEVAEKDLPGLTTAYEKQKNMESSFGTMLEQRVFRIPIGRVAFSDLNRIQRHWRIWKACREENYHEIS